MKKYLFKEIFDGECQLLNQVIIEDAGKIVWVGDADSQELAN